MLNIHNGYGMIDSMRKGFVLRAFASLVVITIGVVVLLHNLQVIDFHYWRELWGGILALAIVVAGALLLSDRSRLLWGISLMVFGAVLGLAVMGVITVSLWRVFWPAMIIVAGLGLLLHGRRRPRRPHDDPPADVTAFLSAHQAHVAGTYDGGAISVLAGGVELDMRRAEVSDGAVINVFALMGGITLLLPDDVVVKNRVRGLLGGTEDTSRPDPAANKTIYIDGLCVLGGVEIK